MIIHWKKSNKDSTHFKKSPQFNVSFGPSEGVEIIIIYLIRQEAKFKKAIFAFIIPNPIGKNIKM
jgi:hypothetical protein